MSHLFYSEFRPNDLLEEPRNLENEPEILPEYFRIVAMDQVVRAGPQSHQT